MADGHEIIIIGGGASGLAAARVLTAAGRHVTLIEARPYLGGRIHTLRPPRWNCPIEAGAEFIHGKPEETLEIVRMASLAPISVSEEHWSVTPKAVVGMDFEGLWKPVSERLDTLDGCDLAFADFLAAHCRDLPPAVQENARNFVEGFDAADAGRVSALWIRESERSTGASSGASRIPEGYDRIVDALASESAGPHFDLHLDCIVRSIHWRAGSVDVEAITAAGEIVQLSGRAVLITVPLGVLQAPAGAIGAIEFVPAIREKRRVWENLPFGAVVKIDLLFTERFWLKAGVSDLSFLHTPSSAFQTWWTSMPDAPPMLTGWAGGPAGAHISGLAADKLLGNALGVLAAGFSIEENALRELLTDWKIFNWQNDPFSRGAYGFVPAGGIDLSRQLAEPIAGVLFFSGEATDRAQMGTVPGAIASGTRGAREILRAVG